MFNIKKIIILLYPLNIKIFGALNLVDFLLIPWVKITNTALWVIGAAAIYCLLYLTQLLFNGVELAAEGFFFPVKILILSIYISTILSGRIVFRLNSAVVLIIFIPMLISFFGFFSPSIHNSLLTIYGSSNSNTWRYGGIFGDDVNTFGMYATLMLIFIYLSYKTNHNNFYFALIEGSVCFFLIVVSGMRIGLLALLVTIAIYTIRKGRLLNLIRLYWLYILLAFAVLFTIIGSYHDNEYIDLLLNRFSISTLGGDFDYGSEGNLYTAINYFSSVTPRGFGYVEFLIGYDASAVFVDNLFLFIFVKYGVVGIFLFFMLSLLAYKEINKWDVKNNTGVGNFLFLFSFISALKGIFPLGGYYIYMALVIISTSNLSNFRLDSRIDRGGVGIRTIGV